MIRVKNQSWGYELWLNDNVIAEITIVNGKYGFTFLSELIGSYESRAKMRNKRGERFIDMYRLVRNAVIVGIMESEEFIKIDGV